MSAGSVLSLEREQILGFRRRVGALDARLDPGPRSVESAAHAGLQDSMPRAALLSLSARVRDVRPSAWEEPPLVQVWGPRFSAYAVAERDRGVFTLGRHPDDPARRRRAEDLAARLRAHLGEEARPYEEVGKALGVNPNSLRYATTTGTVLIRWEGARRPLIRMVAPPAWGVGEARRELVRRYLHVLGPGAPAGFGEWAGLPPADAARVFSSLRSSLTAVRTPVGERWILSADEPGFRGTSGPPAPARLLPSGDALFLLQGADRALLVPDPARRAELWTPRVWPGAVLLAGEIRGTWRRAKEIVSVTMWGRISAAERDAVEAEAAALPLPGVEGRRVRVRWVQ
jgi:hypothetical protein